MTTHNNQLGVVSCGKRDVGEEAREGWNVWEGGVQSLEATNSMQKISNLKYTVALGGRRLSATHNNKLGVGSQGRRDVGEEARGVWNVWEGGVQSLEATNSMQKNIE